MTDAKPPTSTDEPPTKYPLKFVRASNLPRGATDQDVKEAVEEIDAPGVTVTGPDATDRYPPTGGEL